MVAWKHSARRLSTIDAQFATTHVGGDASARAPTEDPVVVAKFKRAKAELENVLEGVHKMHIERTTCRAKIERTKSTIASLRRDIAREQEATARIRAERVDIERENERLRRVEHESWMRCHHARAASRDADARDIVVDARILRDYARKLREIDDMARR